MQIIVQYGTELELGASQFDDLDVDATNEAWCALVQDRLQKAFPDADVAVTYDRHSAISETRHIIMEDATDEDQENVRNVLWYLELQATDGTFGSYAVQA